MIASILRHEWKDLTSDRGLWIVTAAFALLTVYGVCNGANWVRFEKRTLASAAQEQAERKTRLKTDLGDFEAGRKRPEGFLDPQGAASIGGVSGVPYLTLPPAPLASFSIGQSDLYPYYLKAGLRSRQLSVVSDEVENPSNLLSGRFDLAFVIVFLYPLLILALSYDLISSEKERGTLALALSQPVSLRILVLGKLAIRAAWLLACAMLFAALAGSIAGVELSASRFLLWTAVTACYEVFWFTVAVAVNLLGKNSATNALSLAAIWLGLVLILPACISLCSSAIYPVPSRVEMIQAMREATQSASQQGGRMLARYFDDHPDLMPVVDRTKAPDVTSTTYIVQREVDRLMQPVVDEFDSQAIRQQAVVDRWRFLSPAVLTQGALNDISGTGIFRYREFTSAADRFLAEWRGYFMPRLFQRAKIGSGEIDGLPVFRFAGESSSAVAARVAPLLAGVLLPALLIAILFAGRFKRYPVQ